MNKQKVLILGYGEMGHAMQALLGERYQLLIWDIYSNEQFTPVDLEVAVPQADLIIFCLPVNPHKKIAQSVEPLLKKGLKKGSICLSIAKGLDEEGHCAAEVFAEVFGNKHRYAMLYGPMISEEIRDGRYAFAQLGCDDHNLFVEVLEYFKGSHLYLQHSRDMVGISWSVILKNVFAMVFGFADELGLGTNTRGFLAVTALHELDQIVTEMGGQHSSAFHLAGLGDLITTGTSADSHHHGVGQKLARGETEGIDGEGVHTLQMVQKFKLFNSLDYPLFHFIERLIDDPSNGKQRFEAFLKREYSEINFGD